MFSASSRRFSMKPEQSQREDAQPDQSAELLRGKLMCFGLVLFASWFYFRDTPEVQAWSLQ